MESEVQKIQSQQQIEQEQARQIEGQQSADQLDQSAQRATKEDEDLEKAISTLEKQAEAQR